MRVHTLNTALQYDQTHHWKVHRRKITRWVITWPKDSLLYKMIHFMFLLNYLSELTIGFVKWFPCHTCTRKEAHTHASYWGRDLWHKRRYITVRFHCYVVNDSICLFPVNISSSRQSNTPTQKYPQGYPKQSLGSSRDLPSLLFASFPARAFSWILSY